eukprot:839404_1
MTTQMEKDEKKKRKEASGVSGSKKKDKLAKSKKTVSYKDTPKKSNTDNENNRLNPNKKDRHRSASISTNKTTNTTSSSLMNAKQTRDKTMHNTYSMKRHSMIHMRSRSQNPIYKQNHQHNLIIANECQTNQ